MLALNNISVYFGADPLFSEISLRINPKEKIALAGRNGAGKTTMLNIIAKRIPPTSGHISHPTDMTIGYLPQHLLTQDTRTVREEAGLAFAREMEIKQTVDLLTQELSTRTDYDSEDYMEVIQRLSNYTELLSMYASDRKEAEIEKTLKGLGFIDTDFDRPTSEFSGGWRMRIELAKILLGRPDLLLLDEPTNHLDMESIIWLEGFIKSTSAAVVMVSHDRKFLDNTTTRTVELSLGKAYDYKASYSHYLTLREERYQQQLRAYENQQKMIKDTEDFIERFRYKATKSVQVQSRIKQLDKVERIEIEEIDRRRIHFRFPMAVPSGAYPLIIEGLSVSYDQLNVLKSIDLTIERGQKIALVGKNGSGKTTFIRAVMGEIPYSGTIKEGHQVEVSYFAQNQAALLPPHKTIFETIDDVAVGEIRTRINDILGAFMFGGEVSEKKVQVLSGGERSRLAMIRLLLAPSNVLILDEPTNHLDISSKEVLKEAIKHYEGTVLIVSHDRDFLDGLVDKVLEFKDKKVISHLGGMPDYLTALSLRTEELQSSSAQVEKTSSHTSPSGKTDYALQKEQQKALRKIQQHVSDCEEKIQQVEEEISEIESKMSDGDTSPALISRYDELQQVYDRLMSEWTEAQQALESHSN